MVVKVIGIDRATGKIRLSRREAHGQDARTSSTTSATRGRLVARGMRGGRRPGSAFRSCGPGPLAPRYMSAGAAGLDLASAAAEADRDRAGRAGRRCPPGWRSRSRPASRGRCVRARGWRASSASRCPTRPGPSTATTGARCRCCSSTWAPRPTSSSRATAIAQLVIAPVVIAELEEVDDRWPTATAGTAASATPAAERRLPSNRPCLRVAVMNRLFTS